jgi:hypothetical protein
MVLTRKKERAPISWNPPYNREGGTPPLQVGAPSTATLFHKPMGTYFDLTIAELQVKD